MKGLSITNFLVVLLMVVSIPMCSTAQQSPEYVLVVARGDQKKIFTCSQRVVIKTSNKKLKGYLSVYTPDSVYIQLDRWNTASAKRISIKDIRYIRRLYTKFRTITLFAFLGSLVVSAADVPLTGIRYSGARDDAFATGLGITFVSIITLPLTFIAESANEKDIDYGWNFSAQRVK